MTRRNNVNPETSSTRRAVHGLTGEYPTAWLVTGSRAIHRLLVLLLVVGLGADACVHWNLAPGFDTLSSAASPHISQGELFRLEAGVAVMAGLLVLLTRHRFAAMLAFLIAAGGLGAVLLYGYVDVGAFGPLPDMYDPVWYPEKTISAIAEAVSAVAAFCLLLQPHVASESDG
jgi:hypothetical protein